MGGIDLYDDEDIKAYIKEIIAFNKEVDIDELEAESLITCIFNSYSIIIN